MTLGSTAVWCRRTATVLVAATLVAGCQSDTGSPGTDRSQPPPASTAESGPAPEHGSATTGDPTPSAPDEASHPGVSATEYARARDAVRRMSVREQAGQVMVISYSGTTLPVDEIQAHHYGGVIAFSENVGDPTALRKGIEAMQRSDRRPWPLLVGVDQEGGIVSRVGAPLTPFPTFMSYGAAHRPKLAERAATASGEELRALGFTAVFAPDADVTSGPDDPTIGSRSASSDPEQVATAVTASVKGYEKAGILPVVKHFPGHGSVPADSHATLPVQTRSLGELRRRDLVPFRAAVDDRAPAIMVGHLDIRAVDPGVPASVSKQVIQGLLRDRLGFRGLVVTDSLQMAAITDRMGSDRAAVQALRSGADVLLMPADPAAAQEGLVAAVEDGTLPRDRLADAATAVVAQQLHVAAVAAPEPDVVGSHSGLSQRVSAAAITSVAGRCSGRLVGDSVSVRGDSDAVTAFRRAARRAGLRTGSGDSVVLIGYGGGPATGDVVVTTDTPYPLGRSRARVKLATYGDTPGAMRALVDVLLGRHRAPGKLPVQVDGLPRAGC